MILTAHQPVYLPWLGLFHKIALADTFVSFNQAQYLPKDWNNRNKIKTTSGDCWLTVPVYTKGHREKPIAEIEINNKIPWRRKHWRSIALNYRSTPYFERYASFFEDVYARDWQFLAELNEHMLEWFLSTLGLSVQFLSASDFHFEGHKSALVLDMCRQLDADMYVFGTLGGDYVVREDFEAEGIAVTCQDYKHPVYPQQHGSGFLSHLSVIDLIFNCGDESLDILMGGNLSRSDLIQGLAI